MVNADQNYLNVQKRLKEELDNIKDNELITQWKKEDRVREEARIARIKEKGFVLNERGEKEAIWAVVKRRADELGKISGQASYVQYSTAMMELVAYLVLRGQAIESDNRPGLLTMAWRETVGRTELGEQITGTLDFVGAKVDDEWKKAQLWAGKNTPIIKLIEHATPVIHYTVEVDATGKLDTALSIDGQVIADGDGKKMLFDTGVVAWLQDVHNCTFNFKDQEVFLPDGSPLTPDRLKDFSVDNDDGLIAFFQNREGLTISPKGP